MTVGSAITPDDLPAWMRPRQRLPDLGILLALSVAITVALPLLARSSIPPYSALPSHALRAAETARLLREGVLYPRWASGFHFTYGSPVLNYLPPLPHMLAALHQIVTEATPTQSVKAVTVVAWIAAAVGMYAFGRSRFGVRGGVLAALCYLMSAPIAFSLPYQLGEVPYLLALGLLPCAAAALDALWRAGDRRAFASALVFCVAFYLCDPRLAFLGGTVLGAVALSGRLYAPAQARSQRWLLFAALFVLTFLLTAFYWLPTLLERDAVRWLSTGMSSFAAPIPLTESLLSVPYYDLSAQNPPVLRGVGLGVVITACLALFLSGQQRVQVGIFIGLGLAFVLLSSPIFERLWRTQQAFFLPILPYHAVLMATFSLAAAAGGAGLIKAQGLRGAAQLGALALVPFVPMQAAFFPPTWIEYDVNMSSAAFEGELSGYHAASLREGVLLPSTAGEPPRPLPNLIDKLRLGQPVDRVNRATLSGGGQISPLAESGLTWRYIVNTLEDNLVEFFFQSAPNWRAQLRDKKLPLSVSPNGFVQVPLPATNAELVLSLEETLVSKSAWALTAAGAVVAFIILQRLPKTQLGTSSTTSPLRRTEQVVLISAVLLAQSAALLIRWQPDLILPRSERGTVLGEMTPLPRFSQAGIDLLGYHLPRQTVQRGEVLALTLYWRAARPLLEHNQSEIRLINVETGEIVARHSNRHIGGIPTIAWQLSGYVRDELQLIVPFDLPAGNYLLKVALGVCNQPLPLPCEFLSAVDAYDAQGRAERNGITIPQVIRVE
ncbi:MAG: hypothetical protein RML95_08105 [Anaerolineae bacterium]|nr:hypothetical protein [Anaerolineae bacterium]